MLDSKHDVVVNSKKKLSTQCCSPQLHLDAFAPELLEFVFSFLLGVSPTLFKVQRLAADVSLYPLEPFNGERTQTTRVIDAARCVLFGGHFRL